MKNKMGNNDLSLEMSRWNKIISQTFVFVGLSAFFMLVFLVYFWIADGYATGTGYRSSFLAEEVQLLGLGELWWFSLSMGVFVGGSLGVFGFSAFSHPIHDIQVEKRRLYEKIGNNILSEGETLKRGAMIKEGPWPEQIDACRKKNKEAASYINNFFSLN